MALAQTVCQSCAGYGILACSACYCKRCGATGSIPCRECESGQVSCQKCRGTGRLQETKKWLLFSYTVERSCDDCSHGRRACPACQGNQRLKCADCDGLKYQKTCSGCNRTRQVTCAKCAGVGRFESTSRKSRSSMSKDDLRFEHEKYRAVRNNLEATLSRLENGRNRVWDRYQQGMDKAQKEGWLDCFDFERYRRDLEAWEVQIGNCQAQMRDTDEELRLIELELKRMNPST